MNKNVRNQIVEVHTASIDLRHLTTFSGKHSDIKLLASYEAGL